MADAPQSQRIDSWLWHARFFKTRTLAGSIVAAGKVRVTRNGATSRVQKTSTTIKPGDELTFPQSRILRIVRIAACSTRRGPAPEAQALYEDLTPAPLPREKRVASPAQREEGSGRPTKKERRALDSLRDGFQDPET